MGTPLFGLARVYCTTEFNLQNQQVRLGNTWKESRATIEGGEPLTKASVTILKDTANTEQTHPRTIINTY